MNQVTTPNKMEFSLDTNWWKPQEVPWYEAERCKMYIRMYDIEQWGDCLKDPFREEVFASGMPDLDKILSLFPPASIPGPPFEVLNGNMERLETNPKIDLGHPFLDLSVKMALAHIDATFQGDHPKYGLESYASNAVDGFPQIIISVVDALSAWGLHERAAQLWRYWLLNMIHADGIIKYRATCLGEYGQLLHTAALLQERAGIEGWWEEGFQILNRLAAHVIRLWQEVQEKDGGLLFGSADEDLHSMSRRYFQTNAWLSKGLRRWAELCERVSASPTNSLTEIRAVAESLAKETIAAVRATWPEDPNDWWLSPCIEPVERPRSLTDTSLASYTNYRYYPELLSSGILPSDLANRVVEARLHGGGQFCGMTRFRTWTDHWTLAEYLYGLWDLGRKNDFLFSLYAHLAFQQDRKTLSACEQMTLPPGHAIAPYCLPCQLTPARAARLLVNEK